MVNRLGIDRLKAWLVAGIGVLAMSATFMFVSANPASAELRHFCWNANLAAGGGTNSTCDSYYHDGWVAYFTALGGSGFEHSVCVLAWYKNGTTMCSGGPLQGVYNETPSGEIADIAEIYDNAPGATKVQAYAATCANPGSPCP